METNLVSKLFFLFCMILLLGLDSIHCKVSYDRKALVINGSRKILFSASIHYPRNSPEMWGYLIQKAKDGGIDVIDTYVFWNGHEPSPGNYYFEGRFDIVRFIKTVQQEGLYAHLRIGPYVCAERNFGGFPVWLKYVPGISFRTDNEPFQMAMQGFAQKIVDLMRSENLFESQGGPIILSQFENEYGLSSKAFVAAGCAYIDWAAKMTVGMGSGVPWLMCKENDAPDPVINTCNDFYCDTFSPNRPYKPLMWTEAWSGWFAEFGGPIHQQQVQDLAFAVGRFIQKGGSFVNYYMYHEGTNFGRTAGGPFVTTSYDYDAPIDEYGLIRQPKYGHLKDLHTTIKLCEGSLISADPVATSLGNLQQANVFSSTSGGCAAFLTNYNAKSAARVVFNDRHYNLPPWSISILPDCKNVVFNTAKVRVQTSQMEMLPSNTKLPSWETYNEDISSLDDIKMIATNGLSEQIDVTTDMSDYLWYITSVEVNPSEPFLHGGELPTLIVQSNGHALHVYVNGQMSGSAYGTRENRKVTFTRKVNLHAGTNKIALLSIAAGLPVSFGKGQTPIIDMDFEDFHFVSLATLPQEVMENVESLEVRAILHLQENVVTLPVIHISDGAQLKILMENLNYKEEELLQLINDDYTKDKSLQSSSLAIPANTSFSFNCAVIFFIAIFVLYGLWLLVPRRRPKDLNELSKKKAPKRKNSRKSVGRSGSRVNTNRKDDANSPEERRDHKIPTAQMSVIKGPVQALFRFFSWLLVCANSVNDVLHSWFATHKLVVSEVELGRGSNGTVVFEGQYGDRKVAVKRLVKAHNDLAEKETRHLIESDYHENIVQMYGVQRDKDFVYLLLERCACSLYNLIDCNNQLNFAENILKDVNLWEPNGHPSSQLLKIMREIILGIEHLHKLGIIHRDLKPQNILISDHSLCPKVSDMGISKRLVGDNTSLGDHPTGYGSSGWQAPEQLQKGPQTRAVDMFSLGCVFFFCITKGNHPFGDTDSERDHNIKADKKDLSKVDHIPEASDLLTRLLELKPETRPSASDIKNHPLFWSSDLRLTFFRDVSNMLKLKDGKSDISIALENVAPIVFNQDWEQKIDAAFVADIKRKSKRMGMRNYDFKSMRDLLRIIRNTLHHHGELRQRIQVLLGPIPDGCNRYFADRFPKLLIEVYKVCCDYCNEEEWFRKYWNR